MKIRYTLLLLFILSLPRVSTAGVVELEQSTLTPVNLDSIVLADEFPEIQYQINVVFLGINESMVDLSYFDSNLPKWQAPIDRFPSYYSGTMIYWSNYSINYNYIFLNQTDVDSYKSYMSSIASVAPIPQFDSIVSNPVFDGETDAEYVPSGLVEKYLQSTYDFTDTPTIFLMDLYSPDPSSFVPHFYNVSEFDIDVQSVPRPYGSTYQVAGGGAFSNILWMDVSAGPMEYKVGSNWYTWDHASTYSNPLDLSIDLEWYIQTSIELRFLESYIYTPAPADRDIRFEYVLVDLAQDPSFDWWGVFNPEQVVSQYTRLNPNFDVSYSLSTWNYSSDAQFMDTLNSSRNNQTRRYNGYAIANYLSGMYTSLFNQSDEETYVIPNFLFAFPDDWLFDSFLGVAWSDSNGEFSFVIGAANQKWSIPGYDLQTPNWFTNVGSPEPLAAGSQVYIGSTQYEGNYPEIFQTSITVNSTMYVEILDSRNFKKFNSSLPYSAVDGFIASSGTTTKNTTISTISNYYWVLTNNGSSPVEFEISIDQFRERAFGFTFVMMHEGGHAVGLSHPHDGWSWELDYDYVDWLWDLSSTQMTYAAHSSNVSYLDIQAYQRGSFSMLYNDTAVRFNDLIGELRSQNRYVPIPVEDEILYMNDTLSTLADDFFEAAENSSRDSEISDLFSALVNVSSMVEFVTGLVSSLRVSGAVVFDILDNASYTADIYVDDSLLVSGIDLSEVNDYFTNLGYSDVSIDTYRNGEYWVTYKSFSWELDGLVLKVGKEQVFSSTIKDTTSISSTSISTSDHPSSEDLGSTTPPTSQIPFILLPGMVSVVTLAILIRRRRS